MTDDPLDREWTALRLERQGGWIEVHLNRPEARNALNPALMGELTDVARLLRLRTDVQAVILTGTDRYFSAGADLSARTAAAAAPTLLEARAAAMVGPDLCRAWEEVEAVTLAAVEGYCIGGGCALAVACDFRIMGAGGYMRLPEVPLGINMSWRSVPRLAGLMGPARAKRFVMFGEATDAETCVAWGLADELAAAGQALTTARAWAEKICGLPPIPVRMTKEAINRGSGAAYDAVSFMDRDQYVLSSRTSDFVEGRKAFFEKRPPKFQGN